MQSNAFRPTLDTEVNDPLIGKAVAGQYRALQLWQDDDHSRFYIGVDITNDSTVGIRIAKDKQSHAKMLDWLAWAMMTTGKHAILAIGHMERSKMFYVVLSEAALDITREQRHEPEPVKIPLSDDV